MLKGVKIKRFINYAEYFKCDYENIEEISSEFDVTEVNAMCGNLKSLFANLINVAPYLSEEQSNVLINIQKPEKISDKAISLMNINV